MLQRYQKDKEVRWFDKAQSVNKGKTVGKNKDKCFYCGRDRHPNNGTKFGWREHCSAKNATCKECKKVRHFANMPACRYKKVASIKIEAINSATTTNAVELNALGPDTEVSIEVEADTGANITVAKEELLQELDWVELEPTNVYIKGYSGIAEPCLGKATINLQRGARYHEEDVFFSNKSTVNFLSSDACKAFGIIPKGFPHEQLNAVKSDKTGLGGQKPLHMGLGQNPLNGNTRRGQKPLNIDPGQTPPKSQLTELAKFGGKEAMSTKTQDVKDEDISKKPKSNEKLLKMVNEFSEVFDKDKLPTMDTKPMVIKLKENYVAKALTVPRKVPYARREEEIKQIRKLEADGILSLIHI